MLPIKRKRVPSWIFVHNIHGSVRFVIVIYVCQVLGSLIYLKLLRFRLWIYLNSLPSATKNTYQTYLTETNAKFISSFLGTACFKCKVCCSPFDKMQPNAMKWWNYQIGCYGVDSLVSDDLHVQHMLRLLGFCPENLLLQKTLGSCAGSSGCPHAPTAIASPASTWIYSRITNHPWDKIICEV